MAQSFPTLNIGQLSHSLEAAVISIGRAEDNMVFLDDASVSGHHAKIEQTENGLVLRDLGSTNGTKVNGLPVTEAVLNDGDQICFGSVVAQFAVNEVSPEQFSLKRADPPKSGSTKGKKSGNQGWLSYIPLTACVVGFGSLLPFFFLPSNRHLSESGFFPVLLLAVTGCGLGCLAFLHLLMPMSLQQDAWKKMGVAFACVAAFTGFLYLPIVDGLVPRLLEKPFHGGGGRTMFLTWIWQGILSIIYAARYTDGVDSATRFVSALLGVGLLEEVTKVAPGALIAYAATARDTATRKTAIMAAFFGGLAFGATEALMGYSPWTRMTEWNLNVLRWFRNVPLHGVWAAISAAMLWDKMPLIKATRNRWKKMGHFVMCLGVASAIHAANNTFASPLLITIIAGLSVWALAKLATAKTSEQIRAEGTSIVPAWMNWISSPTLQARPYFAKAAGICMAAILVSGVFTSNSAPRTNYGSPYFPTPAGPERCIWCGGSGGGYQPGFGWIGCNHCGGRGYQLR